MGNLKLVSVCLVSALFGACASGQIAGDGKSVEQVEPDGSYAVRFAGFTFKPPFPFGQSNCTGTIVAAKAVELPDNSSVCRVVIASAQHCVGVPAAGETATARTVTLSEHPLSGLFAIDPDSWRTSGSRITTTTGLPEYPDIQTVGAYDVSKDWSFMKAESRVSADCLSLSQPPTIVGTPSGVRPSWLEREALASHFTYRAAVQNTFKDVLSAPTIVELGAVTFTARELSYAPAGWLVPLGAEKICQDDACSGKELVVRLNAVSFEIGTIPTVPGDSGAGVYVGSELVGAVNAVRGDGAAVSIGLFPGNAKQIVDGLLL